MDKPLLGSVSKEMEQNSEDALGSKRAVLRNIDYYRFISSTYIYSFNDFIWFDS